VNGHPVVHQFTPVLIGRDAVGHHTLQVDQILRELGADTTIYAQHTKSDLKNRVRRFELHPSDPAPDLIIYQAATGSPIVDYLMTRSEPIVINYHNMTPAEFFYPYEPHIGAELDHGRQQLARLCRKADFAIADSDFNANELRALGLDRVGVVPVLFDGSVLPADNAAVSGVASKQTRSKVTVLFVGRIAPNKRHEDLLASVAVLRRWVNDIELVLVGSSSSESYTSALQEFAARIGIDDIVRFMGSVSAEELVACYQAADVFLCLSAHEGFCVPLVEAMAWGVPVIALEASAVPTTAGDAGLLVKDPSPTLVATAIERVLTDEELGQQLIDRGLRRAKQLSPPITRQLLRDTLEPFVAGDYSRR